MPITRPTIPVAEKGAPITAEAWNAMRAAILNLYDLLDAKPVTGRIKVSVAGKGREALAGAVVVAVRKDDSAIRKEAVLQGDTFVLDELPEATWLVTASAAGYVSETTTAIVTAGETETLALALAKQEATVVMPQVKESDLAGAIAALKAKGLANVKAEDEFGKYVSTQDPGLYQTAKVTEQKPASGEVVPVSRTIELRVQAMRQMPALKGGKLAEALDAVIKSGLAVAAISLEGGGNLDKNDVPAHYYGAEVLEQSPAAGAVPAAQPVTLHVRAMRVMPDLAGKMKLQDALSALTTAGLGLKEITISSGGT
ncbi:MAG TPA: PASTA domain-containing protein, partial [Symbiobacteriaceae bacterium]|nr:PASTA domain-containing protein [Symbiobacteriaceae bacterium]